MNLFKQKPFSIALIVLYLLIFSTCGIPDYPYLFPPDALGDPEVGFKHDDRNDPDVFEGYEIYYKFYRNEDPDDGIAVSEMNSYFNTSSSFYSISNNTSGSTAYAKGFRKLILDVCNIEAIPQLDIASSEKDDSFSANLVALYGADNIIRLTLSNYLSGDVDLYCYRTVDNSADGYKSFLPYDDINYSLDDSDIIFPSFDPGIDELFVAFFAVTFGYDDDGVAIFSNFSSDGMEYIGCIEL